MSDSTGDPNAIKNPCTVVRNNNGDVYNHIRLILVADKTSGFSYM
jgi:hypothetical protein